jgi:hypothetical protein
MDNLIQNSAAILAGAGTAAAVLMPEGLLFVLIAQVQRGFYEGFRVLGF